MKRYFIFIIVALSIQYAWSQGIIDLSTGQVNNNLSTKPIYSSIVNENSSIITYEFNAAKITEDDLFPNTYNWQYEDFNVNHIQGEAAFPIKYDTFSYPQGTNIEVSVIEANYIDFYYELAPARQLIPENMSSNLSKEDILPIQPYSGISPNEIIEIDDQQTSQKTTTFWVKVSPVQYDYTNKIVRAYTKIKYEVIVNTPIQSRIGDLIITPFSIEQDSIAVDYLIISTNEFSAASNKMAAWKRQLGFNTIVALNDNWNPSSIKSKMREVYERHSDNCYALIIGDHDDVPSNVSTLYPYNTNPQSEHLTDLYYGCFNGDDDYFPEIAIGRIAVSTSNEANIVIDKIINYEKTPPLTPSFYNSGLVSAEFMDSTSNTIEDIPIIQTTESIRNNLIAKGKNIDRIYFAEDSLNPQYYYNGSQLPSELKKPNFAWNNNDTEIINALNNGRLFALHYGHGNINGWAGPYFVKGQFIYLNNSNLLPVVFSFNCSTGDFNRDCFAESFLKKQNGGCVGIFAGTSPTFLYYDSFNISYIFSTLWPQSDLSTPEFHIGDLLNNSKYTMATNSNASPDMRKYQCEIYHCFGDPSMMIRTETPTTIPNISVNRNAEVEGAVRVSITGNEDEYIAFKDNRLGKTLLIKGRNALYRTKFPEYVTVCVYNHNKIPYINLGQEPEIIQPLNTSESADFISTVGPNPTNGQITIVCSISESASSANIVVCDLYGNTKSIMPCSAEDNVITMDLSVLNNGIYVATLIVDGIKKDTKRIIVQK